MNTEIVKNNHTDIKLYSSKAICGATFLGGPLAAGYLIGENFKVLKDQEARRNSIIIGILSTIILFGGIFLIPENIIDKIPNQIIPLIYTGIVWGIVEWKQGEALKTHKDNGNVFFSGWRAAGIGFISLIIISALIFGYVFFGMDYEVYNNYDKKLSIFSQNEVETLVFYDDINTKSNLSLLQDLESTIIPKWKENVRIIEKTNEFEELPLELVEQNKILLKYSQLRIQAFELFKKAIEEDTEEYSPQLEQIHREIEIQLQKLN